MFVCCVRATRMPDCLALTPHNQRWPVMKSDSGRLSPAEYFPLWELHQLNRESYLTISV